MAKTNKNNLLDAPILVLSPHADDAVLSCGSLLMQHEDARVITVYSADPPLPRPGFLAGLASPSLRREEDTEAMRHIGCQHSILDFPDAVDRSANGKRLYTSIEALFGVVLPQDGGLCTQIEEAVAKQLEDRILVCPMAVGAHVDHQLCAHVGRRLQRDGHTVWFYPDAPYCFPDAGPAVAADSVMLASRRLRARIWENQSLGVDARAKAELVAIYASQVQALFGDLLSYEYLLEGYHNEIGGELEHYHQLRW